MIQYLQNNQDTVSSAFVQHLQLSVVALVIALAIALPVGIVISRYARLSDAVVSVLGIVYTIPSLALLAVLVVIVGIGPLPVTIALVIYAQFALVRNIVTGLRGVDPTIVEAARGMGMSPLQVLVRVKMPLALPVIVAGLRIATVVTIGIAAIGAIDDAGGLGRLLYEGNNNGYNEEIEVGAVATAVLALAADIVLRVIEWAATRATGSAQSGARARM